MKKGFTLIELVVTIGIVSMLICLELTIFSSFLLSYKRNIKNDRESFYIRDGLSFIECKAANNEGILISNNQMQIIKTEYSKDNDKSKDIKYTYAIYLNIKGEIMISYNEKNTPLGVNVITSGVKTFNVDINKQILYIHIVSNRGAVFDKCIGIN